MIEWENPLMKKGISFFAGLITLFLVFVAIAFSSIPSMMIGGSYGLLFILVILPIIIVAFLAKRGLPNYFDNMAFAYGFLCAVLILAIWAFSQPSHYELGRNASNSFVGNARP